MKKRMIALILAFVMIFCNAFTINAVGIIGEMITDLPGLNRLTVSAALNDYFDSRKAFLLNQADTINVPLAGMVEDEAAHREEYISEDIIFINSVISIGEVSIYEANANAEVAETITYEKNGVTNTATVTHKLFLVPNNNNVPVICADLYFEEFSGFKSCSYVDETRSSAMIAVEGSGSCIVHTAEAELGEGEDANGQTKYGIWYGKPTANWCAIFVSWCANQSNIATSIIPRTEGPSVLKSRIQYCARSNAVGANAPQTGDLVYFSWTGTNLDHVGIVRWADASSIYVVHGNNSNGVVAYWTVSRTDARIDGYGKPAYTNAGHTGVTDVAEDFYYDSAEHWVLCINCGHACENEPHDLTYTTTLTKHKASCSTCEYEGTYVNHHSEVYDWDDTKHWKYCDACDAYFASGTHNLVATNVSWMYVCLECEYETRITRSVDETSE